MTTLPLVAMLHHEQELSEVVFREGHPLAVDRIEVRMTADEWAAAGRPTEVEHDG